MSKGSELAELDAELERFASGDTSQPEASRKLKGGSLLARLGGGGEAGKSERRIAALPGRRRGAGGDKGGNKRPAASKDSLDAELDAFLTQKD